MPYEQTWVNPKLYLKHNDLKVWCTYKDDDCENNPPDDHRFTFDREYGAGGHEDCFDVRELKNFKQVVEERQPQFIHGDKDTAEVRRAKKLLWAAWQDGNGSIDGAETILTRELVRMAIDSGEIKPGGDEEE